MRADAQRNRERLLSAAVAAFARDGLGTSLDRIAREAGVGAGTLYRHFPTREALVDAVLLEEARRLVRRGAQYCRLNDPWEGFRRLVEDMAAVHAGNQALGEVLGERVQEAGSHVREAAYELGAAAGELRARAQAAGLLREDFDLADLQALLAGVRGAPRADGGPGSWQRFLLIALDGLRTTPRAETTPDTNG